MKAFDAVILGGGPAGSATALALRRHAPQWSVAVVEATHYDNVRIGEMLPPLAGALLDQLDVRTAVAAAGFRPVAATAAAWGAPAPHENHFIYSARGHGWHLDRARFDGLLAESAEARGSTLLLGRTLQCCAATAAGWELGLDDGSTLAARFVVDATGRRRSLLRQLGIHGTAHDRLAAYLRFFADDGSGDPRTLIEARPEGWWYSAPLPAGRRVIACMTDTDLGRQLQLAQEIPWRKLLATTDWTRRNLNGALLGAEVRAAGSWCSNEAGGPGWLAVGDAASAFDPLSSQGISKALRSGILAAFAIADQLRDKPADGDRTLPLARYAACIRQEFASYRRIYAQYYGTETRWPDAPFWQRRLESAAALAV